MCGECHDDVSCSTFWLQRYLRCHVDDSAPCTTGRSADGGCGGMCDDAELVNPRTARSGVCMRREGLSSIPGPGVVQCEPGLRPSRLGCIDDSVLSKVRAQRGGGWRHKECL